MHILCCCIIPTRVHTSLQLPTSNPSLLQTYLIFAIFNMPPYFRPVKSSPKKLREYATKNSVIFWLAYLVSWWAYFVFGWRTWYFDGLLGFLMVIISVFFVLLTVLVYILCVLVGILSILVGVLGVLVGVLSILVGVIDVFDIWILYLLHFKVLCVWYFH